MTGCIKSLLPILALSCASPLPAGEWMFRLKDAHVQLRQAMFDRDPDAAWEQVNRHTRQEAGKLAARIRSEFDSLTAEKKVALRKALGLLNREPPHESQDHTIRGIEGKHLLVAPFFLKAHPELLLGDRDETRLKNHGTRMAGPTGIRVAKGTSNEILVVYTFTAEAHFGGQAMDYRAQFDMPLLASIPGSAPPPEAPTSEAIESEALAVFQQVRKALANKDANALWPLLDCDSQSQANHFTDQAHEWVRRKKSAAETARRMGISEEVLHHLEGPFVWFLPWAVDDLKPLAQATKPRYREAEAYENSRLLIPQGFRLKGRPQKEPVIEFDADGRSWQIPARVNWRNGRPEVKLFLRSPYYLRIRGK